ncbi:MAG: DedA family protein [Alphaproteobacteria bacterium]|nr:MAG: DedA family protein [Alphaproteobacteria bacterium]
MKLSHTKNTPQHTLLHRGYHWMMSKANHPHAVWYLGVISFVESSFFPFPPDPLLIVMTLQRPNCAWWYACVCTVTSVLGGFLGYLIGYLLYTSVGESIITFYGLEESFTNATDKLNEWAFWAIAVKGITPIPYKLVTIASGVAKVDLLTFTVASVIARGVRFTYVTVGLYYFGDYVRTILDRHLVAITTIMVASLFLGFVIIKWLF